MASSSKMKLKLLYLMRILLEKSNENHSMTVTDIDTKLQTHDIPSVIKFVYSYIELLKEGLFCLIEFFAFHKV